MPLRLSPLVLLAVAAAAVADGPQDNVAEKVRPVPPKGAAVSDADRQELTAGLAELKKEIDALPAALKGKPALLELLPDVEVYHKAVRYAVEFDEIYVDKGRDDVKVCRTLLKQGLDRARQLKDGKPAWTTATGLVVRGYRSRIDGSVQPYGLVVPASYSPATAHRFRLDFWWHGRGEVLTEANFIDQRQRSPGEFTPANAFVVHPYGRYCNANKFAGEVDTLEVLEHVRKHYPIDEDRIAARGFSMGGAACWQFAVHYPTLFAAAAPGAGFAETPEFLNNFQNEKVQPEWWERRLWRMYNATDYAGNLFNLPTVAYSGEIDKQKQAADVMAREMLKEGLDLVHLIGPKTPHRYEPGAKTEVNRRIDAIMAAGRDRMPRFVRFTTHTLAYNHSGWVRVDGLARHWERADVAGETHRGRFDLTTKNVTALTIDVPSGAGDPEPPSVRIDGVAVWTGAVASDRSVRASFRKDGASWRKVDDAKPDWLAKVHGLQGPIDDAFMDRFLMVRPTGTPMNETVGKWAAGEMAHAVEHWRKQFRGDAPVKDDTAVTDNDIRTSHLVLWGDPASNQVLAKIAARLPLKWSAKMAFDDGKRFEIPSVVVNGVEMSGTNHVPVFVYPNPLNPTKYVVVNSGFTFREYDYLNNARQVPRLPDYAVLDVSVPANARWPGRVVKAGFFGERWEFLPDDGRDGK